jgi:hypothetical protein
MPVHLWVPGRLDDLFDWKMLAAWHNSTVPIMKIVHCTIKFPVPKELGRPDDDTRCRVRRCAPRERSDYAPSDGRPRHPAASAAAGCPRRTRATKPSSNNRKVGEALPRGCRTDRRRDRRHRSSASRAKRTCEVSMFGHVTHDIQGLQPADLVPRLP